MRRLFALLLIVTSGWLLYRTATIQLGSVESLLSPTLMARIDDPIFMVPAVGGVLGMLGGLTVFFGGPGGAALALIAGLAVSGFTLTIKQTFELDHILDNEMAVGAAMLMLAVMTASIARVTRRSRAAERLELRDRNYSSGRRIF